MGADWRFVPAAAGEIGLVDRLFPHQVGASMICRVASLHLWRINETANIVNNATERKPRASFR